MKTMLGAFIGALSCCIAVAACGGGGTGGGGTGGGGTGAGSTGTGGGGAITKEDACEQLATVNCDGQERCGNADFLGNYGGDKALCVSRNKAACVASLGIAGVTVTPAAIAGCAQARSALACVGYYGPPPHECDFRGSKENGVPCALGTECKSGVCLSIGDSGCGTCVDQPAEGADCDNATGGCGRLACTSQNTCAQYGLLGASCDDSYSPCNPTYDCDKVSKECTEVVMQEGADCTSEECSYMNALDCSSTTHKCELVPPATVGDQCAYACDTGWCSAITFKCTAWAAEGEDCSSTLCQPPAICAAGKCTLTPPTCQ